MITPYRNGDDPYAAGQHRGIDIAAAIGTTVVAAAGGEVRFAGTAGSSGITVSIRTADGLLRHLLPPPVLDGGPQGPAGRDGRGGRGGRHHRRALGGAPSSPLRPARRRHSPRLPRSARLPPAARAGAAAAAPNARAEPCAGAADARARARPRGPAATRAGTAPTPPAPAATRARRPRGSLALRPVPTPRPGAPRMQPAPRRATPASPRHPSPVPAQGALAGHPHEPLAGPRHQGPDLGWALACLGLLAAAAILGLSGDGRDATSRSRERVAGFLRPLLGRR